MEGDGRLESRSSGAERGFSGSQRTSPKRRRRRRRCRRPRQRQTPGPEPIRVPILFIFSATPIFHATYGLVTNSILLRLLLKRKNLTHTIVQQSSGESLPTPFRRFRRPLMLPVFGELVASEPPLPIRSFRDWFWPFEVLYLRSNHFSSRELLTGFGGIGRKGKRTTVSYLFSQSHHSAG